MRKKTNQFNKGICIVVAVLMMCVAACAALFVSTAHAAAERGEEITVTEAKGQSVSSDLTEIKIKFSEDIFRFSGEGTPEDSVFTMQNLEAMPEFAEFILINGMPIDETGHSAHIVRYDENGPWGMQIDLYRVRDGAKTNASYSVPRTSHGTRLVPYANEIIIKAGFPMWDADSESDGQVSATDKVSKDAYIYNKADSFILGDRSFVDTASAGSIAYATFSDSTNYIIRLFLDGGNMFDGEVAFNHVLRRAPETLSIANTIASAKRTLDGTVLNMEDYAVQTGLRYTLGHKISINGKLLIDWLDAPLQAALEVMEVGTQTSSFMTAMGDYDGSGDIHLQKAASNTIAGRADLAGKDMLYITVPKSGSKTTGGVTVEWSNPDLSDGNIEIALLQGFGGASATAQNIVLDGGAKAVYGGGGWMYGGMELTAGIAAVISKINAISNPVTLSDAYIVADARTAYDELTGLEKDEITNYSKLTVAEAVIAGLITPQNITDMIAAIPAILTLADKPQIEAARAAYEMLDGTGKSAVINYALLTTAEKRIVSLSKAQDVVNLINALPANMTLTDKTQVETARAAYDALTETEKKSVTNYNKLTNAEDKIISLNSVKSVSDTIAKLPPSTSMTIDNKAQIEAVRAAYEALTESEKTTVTGYSRLTAAEAKIESLILIKDVSDMIAALSDSLTLSDKAAVTAARTAYDNLSTSEKAAVSNYTKLTEAEEKITALEAKGGCSSYAGAGGIGAALFILLILSGVFIIKKKAA